MFRDTTWSGTSQQGSRAVGVSKRVHCGAGQVDLLGSDLHQPQQVAEVHGLAGFGCGEVTGLRQTFAARSRSRACRLLSLQQRDHRDHRGQHAYSAQDLCGRCTTESRGGLGSAPTTSAHEAP